MMTDDAHALEGHTSHKRYSSFLLRCWHAGDGQLRIKLEHVQSGDCVQVETDGAATAWLSEHCAAPHEPDEPPLGAAWGIRTLEVR